ncbi:MAG TPA: antibiotic biosynthesis monooxygenase family protein [Allosphingosinicella sp.]|nr:antibiotic biosynthesis monooxygenase family protein [Allosphingosinicella sp.]
MIQELAQIDVKEGHEEIFEAAAAQSMVFFRRAKGCHGARLTKSNEYPRRYWMIIDWETIEDHMVTFRESADFQEMLRLSGPYFEGEPKIEHLSEVIKGF